jgi:4-alpha-glucanotransferase
MNRPAGREGNWQWRVKRTVLGSSPAAYLGELTEIYGRAAAPDGNDYAKT